MTLRITIFLLWVLLSLILGSCGTQDNVTSPAVTYTHQPIQVYEQPYPKQCTTSLPMTPVCIPIMGGAVDSLMSAEARRASFESCKRDVERFVAAVKFQAECYQTALEEYVEEALSLVNSKIVCEEEQIKEINSGNNGQLCPVISLPSAPDILLKGDYRFISKIDPLPITTFSCDMIEETNETELRQLCIDELTNSFLIEAQTYFDEQLEYYYNGGRLYPKRDGVKKYIDDVIKNFNCKASGQDFCF